MYRWTWLVGFRQAILRCQRDCLERWLGDSEKIRAKESFVSFRVQIVRRKRLLNARSLKKSYVYIYTYQEAPEKVVVRRETFPGLLVWPNLLSRLFMPFQFPRSCDWCCFTQISPCWLNNSLLAPQLEFPRGLREEINLVVTSGNDKMLCFWVLRPRDGFGAKVDGEISQFFRLWYTIILE